MLIDSHAHLTSEEMFPHLSLILARAKEANVEKILNISTDPLTFQRGQELRGIYPEVLQAAAIPPHDVESYGEKEFEDIRRAALSGTLEVIGETGLDYFHHLHTKETQKKWFIRYLELAQEAKLPVAIHCREAFQDLFEVMDAHYKGAAILHCFTGTLDEALQVVKRGWCLSFSGIITFPKSEPLRQVVKEIPLEHLLIETDAPYLAPVPFRGKVNEPAYVVKVAEMIADIKRVPFEKVADSTRITFNNLLK